MLRCWPGLTGRSETPRKVGPICTFVMKEKLRCGTLALTGNSSMENNVEEIFKLFPRMCGTPPPRVALGEHVWDTGS